MEVHQFLNESGGNFTETAPRPPVPGEENELQSNGGTSTRSSGSYKSHISGKSHSSGKSVASHRSDVSLAATPRRSNLDKVGGSETKLDKDIDAPLGFEPEGSAASSPPFTENSTPPYFKWAEKLQYLLEDSDGVRLFKTFLDQEHCSNTLDFWFACSGLKLVSSSDHGRIQNLVKLIYKKYIKGDQLSLKSQIKNAIIDRIKHDLIDQTIFDSAQTDVENAMRGDTYQLFLKSDLYLQYVQTGGESPKTGSNNSSGSNSVRPMSGPLPTLVEDKELDQSDFKKPEPPSLSLSLTTSALMSTASCRYRQSIGANSSIRKSEGAFPAAAPRSYPYHVSYAPVSAQDSELQSLSSDALTDDTMSLTDSSVDGRDVSTYGLHSKSAYRKHQKHMRRYADNNRATDLNQTLIPRTERAPKDRNLAEKDPAKFAKMLTERLQQVKDERDRLDRVRQLNLETDSETETVSKSGPVKAGLNTSGHAGQQSNNTSITELIRGAQPDMIATMLKEQGKEEEEGDEAQSILEAHVSRIWDSSNGQTPSRSPGRHSPPSISPDRSLRRGGGYTHPTPNVSGSGNSLLFTPNPKTHRRSKNKDSNMFLFNNSMDAGNTSVEDRTAYDYGVTKHVYHHHHHHHHVNKDKRHVMEDTSNRGLNYYVSAPHMPTTDSHGVGLLEEPSGRGKRSNKKASDSSSNIDSGVGLHYDAHGPHPQVPNSHDPNFNKVVSWMLGNEKTLSGNTQYSTDGSDKGSSQKRSSHKSQSSQNKSSTSSGHGGHGSSKKQPVQYNVSRSGTLEHQNTLHSFGPAEYSFTQPAAGVQPSQPMVQDPSMPLLPSPNPTTQLEEVKRRLVEEQKSSSKQRNQMLKSESFTGSSSLNSKDKGRMPPPAVPPRPPRNIPPTAPMDLSFSEDHSSSSTKSEKRQQKKAASVPSTPQQSDETVVGYFFCGEPIPYRTTIPGRNITLTQFKQVISKKGNYRYFFKTVSDEFDSGMVLMEVTEDGSVLPLWEGKIVGKVEKVE